MSIGIILLLCITTVLSLVVIMHGIQQMRRTQPHVEKIKAETLPAVQLSHETITEIETKLKEAYLARIPASTASFEQYLDTSSKHVSEQIAGLTVTIVEAELAAYRKTIEEARKSTAVVMEEIRQTIEKQRTELQQGIAAELATEKQIMTEKFETRMEDIVSSYIAESLGGGVDIGAQLQYILTNLEKHKEDIKRDLLNGV